VLGDQWTGMVTPLQLLLVVGVGYAILNCIGEALSGCGEIAFRAKVNVVWSLATLAALVVLVVLDGIRGAALAHLLVFVPYAAVYVTAGARRIGTSPRRLWDAVRLAVGVVLLEAALTAAVAAGVAAAGVSSSLALTAGALAGILVVAAAGLQNGRARKGAATMRRALQGQA
jgi:O-antigen/teichoic acid export membrane protein